MDNLKLYDKLVSLPDHLKSEVSDFIDFLVLKDNRAQNQDKKKPIFGSEKGMFILKPGFDESIEDFKEYMH